jgi:hypothetical protein
MTPGWHSAHRCLLTCRWAQDIAGVDVVSSLPGSLMAAARDQALAALGAYRSQLRLEVLLERLTAAKSGRAALK